MPSELVHQDGRDEPRAFLSLTLNGAPRGEVPVRLGESDVFVPVSALVEAGLDTRALVTREIDGEAYASLSASGLRWAVDEGELTLAVLVDPGELPRQTVRARASTAPTGIEYRRDTSAFLNYGARLVDLSRVDGFLELGANVRNARLYTAVTGTSEDGPVRGASNLTFDSREKLRRLVVGDVLGAGGASGGSVWLGGLQVARTHSLDPYFLPGPTLDQAATVLAPSTLEVYVNDQLVHREEVAAGPLDVTDIPVTAGAGDTRIVLRDLLGREQVLTSRYYRPTGLLAPGEQEYAYSAGFLRSGLGRESWDYGPLAATGTHRAGLTPGLTGAAHAELGANLASGGLGAVASVGFGELEVDVAGSSATGEAGAAGSFAWSYRGERFGGAVWGRGMSPRFANLGLDADDDRTLVESGASFSVPITTQASISLSYAAAAARDAGPSQRASVSAGVRLPLQLQLAGYASWTRGPEENAVSGYLGLTRTFGSRLTGTVRGEAEGADALEASGVAEVQQTLPTGTGVGYRVGGRYGATDEAYARLDGQTSFGRADANVEWRPDATGSSVGVAGGLVAIGGRVFASRPVDASYALVRVPGVGGVHASLNNNYVGRTDRHGDLVVTGLQGNYGNRLSIDDLDVPFDHSIASVERVVAPPERGGAVVEFPVRRSHLVRGKLSVAGGDPAYGEATVVTGDGEPAVSPVGRAGEIEFSDLAPGRWVAEVRYAAGRCHAALEVPAAEAAVVDLGPLECVEMEVR